MKYYPVDVDWNKGLYCGIKVDWDYYHTRSVDLSMPKYFPTSLHEFQHPYPKKTPTCTTKLGTPKLRSKNTMGKEDSLFEILPEQRGK